MLIPLEVRQQISKYAGNFKTPKPCMDIILFNSTVENKYVTFFLETINQIFIRHTSQ